MRETLGFAVVLVTHDLGVAASLADDIVASQEAALSKPVRAKNVFALHAALNSPPWLRPRTPGNVSCTG